MQDEDVKAALAALDLAVHDAWRFFRLLDANGNGAVTEEEFVLGCLRLRGPARTFDVASLSEENLRMKTKLTNLEEQETFIQQLLNNLRIEMMQVGKVATQAKQAAEQAVFARTEEPKKPQKLQSKDGMEGDGQLEARDESGQEVKEPLPVQQVQQGQSVNQKNADWMALQEASMKMALATANFAALIQQSGQVQGFQAIREIPSDVNEASPPVNPVAPSAPLPIAPAPPMSQPTAVFWLEPNVPEGLPVPNRGPDLPYFCEQWAPYGLCYTEASLWDHSQVRGECFTHSLHPEGCACTFQLFALANRPSKKEIVSGRRGFSNLIDLMMYFLMQRFEPPRSGWGKVWQVFSYAN